MEAKELRIGNLVHWCGVAHPISKIEDDIFSVKLDVIGSASSYHGMKNGISPIPLTEEWLIKFGFKDVQRGFFSIKAGSTFFRLTPPQFMGEWQIVYCWVYDDFKFTEIKYVHQLQNLYFAITGEELNLNI